MKLKKYDQGEVEVWLKDMRIKDYFINPDLTVDVDASVDLREKRLTEIPVQFGIINGNFLCSRNSLSSLKGSPSIVNGNFYCDVNELNSLKNCPRIIEGMLDCSYNLIQIVDYLDIQLSEFYHSCQGKNRQISLFNSYYQLLLPQLLKSGFEFCTLTLDKHSFQNEMQKLLIKKEKSKLEKTIKKIDQKQKIEKL